MLKFKKVNKNKMGIFIVSILFILFLFIFNKQDWRYLVPQKVGSHNLHSKVLFFDDHSVFFSDQTSSIFSLDKKSGQENWRFTSDSYTPFEILIEDDFVFLANFDAHIYCLDKKSGLVLWSFAIPGSFLPDTKIFSFDEDNAIFFADRGGTLYSLEKETGSLLWQRQFKQFDSNKKFEYGSIHFGFMDADDKFLYLNNFPEKKFFAIEKKTGEIKLEIPWTANKPPIFYLKSGFLIIDDRESTEVSFYDIEDNLSEKFSFYIWERLLSGFFIDEDKGNLFFQSAESISLNSLEDASVIWKKDILQGERFFDFDKDLGLVLSQIDDPYNFKAYLKAFSWDEGKLLWQVEIPALTNDYLIHDHKMIFQSPQNKILFIDLNNGSLLEEYQLEGRYKQFILFEKYLLFISHDEDYKAIFDCFDLEKNNIIWTYKSELDISKKENQFYQSGDRLFYLNDERYLIESIGISSKNPCKNKIKKVNFRKDIDLRHKKTKATEFVLKENNLRLFFNDLFRRMFFFLGNISDLKDIEVKSDFNELENLELSIKLNENFYLNPLRDVKIETDLFLDGEQVDSREAFYSDFNLWKVRFLLKEKGKYHWQMRIKTRFFSLKRDGDFVVENISPKKELSIHGDTFYLGDNIFWPIGFEDWLNDQNLDGTPLNDLGNAINLIPETKKEDYIYMDFIDYLDLYKDEAGLNIFRYGVGNAKPALWRGFDKNYFYPDVQQNLIADQLTEALVAKDYRIMMTIFAFDPPFTESNLFKKSANKKAIEQYLDYVIARYSSRVDIWEIANETTPSLDWLNFVSDYLSENDPYQHPITTNWPNKELNNSDLLSIHWYSFIKDSNLGIEKEFFWMQQPYYDWDQAKIISELGFKNASYFDGSYNQMRKMLWLNTFDLSASVFWNQPLGINENPDNANIYLGPTERKTIKFLREFLPEGTDSFKKSKTNLDNIVHLYSLENDNFILAYLLKVDQFENKDLSFELNLKRRAFCEWFNPETGVMINSYELKKGSNLINIPAYFDDLALKVTYFD